MGIPDPERTEKAIHEALRAFGAWVGEHSQKALDSNCPLCAALQDSMIELERSIRVKEEV